MALLLKLFNDYFWQKCCTLICLACAPEHPPPFGHTYVGSTCNRSLNIFALFPFGFCKTSALQSCRNFPCTAAALATNNLARFLQRKLLLAMGGKWRAAAETTSDIVLLTVNAIVPPSHPATH